MKVEFDLSEEALATLKEKSEYFHLSEDKVLEWMILEYTPSTKEEVENQIRIRNELRTRFLTEHPTGDPKSVWYNGWKTGWEQFQMRKFNHPFRKVREEATDDIC